MTCPTCDPLYAILRTMTNKSPIAPFFERMKVFIDTCANDTALNERDTLVDVAKLCERIVVLRNEWDLSRVVNERLIAELDSMKAELRQVYPLAGDALRSRADALEAALRGVVEILEEWHGEFPEHIGHKERPALITARALLGEPVPARFYILALKHTRGGDSHLTWWRADSRGYCWSLTHAGLYDEAEAKQIEQGSAHEGMRGNVAVPEYVARAIAYQVVEISDANLAKLGTSAKEWRKAGRL